MDKLDLKSTSERSEIPSARSIRFFFDSGDKDNSFCLDIYEDGSCVWNEKGNGTEKELFYTFSDGQKVFSDLAELFGINDQEINKWNDVDSKEIEDFIMSAYYISSNSQALKISNGTTEYFDIPHNDLLIQSLTCIDWIRIQETDFKENESYNIWGIAISEDGYMSGTYKGHRVCYKVKSEEYLSNVKYALSENLETHTEPVSDPKVLLQKYTNEKTIQWMQGPTGQPQGKMCYDTITRFYSIQDTQKLIAELSEFEW